MARLTEKHRRNTDNLRPWKPGQSGNPKGRPPNPLSITAALRAVADEHDGEAYTRLARRVWAEAQAGAAWAVTFIADRLEGKVTERVRMEINDAEKAAAAMTPEERLAELRRLQEQYEAMTREETHDTND